MAVTAEGKNLPAYDQATLLLMQPRGFCAGVIRAIEIVELALQKLGRPVYVRKEIVHNRHVVEDLAARGAVFVESLNEVPTGAVVIFSAHGVSPSVRKAANERGLQVIDATCPLVTKVHLEVIRYARENYTIVLIGHRSHDEIIGTLGEAPNAIRVISSVEDVDSLEVKDPQRVAYLTQTTLGIDDTADIVTKLKQRFPAIQGPPAQDICYATENRQAAVKLVAQAGRRNPRRRRREQFQLQPFGGSSAPGRNGRVPDHLRCRHRTSSGSRVDGNWELPPELLRRITSSSKWSTA